MAQASRGSITVQAAVLNREQTARLFNLDMARRGVVPVLFAVNNETGSELLIQREHFAVRAGKSRIEPCLPGRAAALLNDSSGSRNAALAGWLIFGIFAAPQVASADKAEKAAVETNREIVFSQADLSPGGRIAGYLFFESPVRLKSLRFFELELCLSGNRDELITVQLANPYAADAEK